MLNDFRLRLEKLADQAGYSKEQMSVLLGFSKNTYGMYVNGKRTPDLETLIKISNILNVSLDKLILGVEYKQDAKEAAELDKLKELLILFKKAGFESPYILQLDDWRVLKQNHFLEITNHFDWVVNKAKEDSSKKK